MGGEEGIRRRFPRSDLMSESEERPLELHFVPAGERSRTLELNRLQNLGQLYSTAVESIRVKYYYALLYSLLKVLKS